MALPFIAQRSILATCVSGLVFALLVFPLILPAHAQGEAVEDSAPTLSFKRKVWTIDNQDDPASGYLISANDIRPNGHNFEFCDGTTGYVEIDKLLDAGRQCEDAGGSWAIDPESLIDAKVFALMKEEDYSKQTAAIGTVTGLFASASNATMIRVAIWKDGGLQGGTGMFEILLDLERNNLDILETASGEFDVILFTSEEELDEILNQF